jgi:hypothetical protein
LLFQLKFWSCFFIQQNSHWWPNPLQNSIYCSNPFA